MIRKLQHNAAGTLQTTFTHIIPFIIMVSESRITNAQNVSKADISPTKGRTYALHITPFFSFGLVIPAFIKQR